MRVCVVFTVFARSVGSYVDTGARRGLSRGWHEPAARCPRQPPTGYIGVKITAIGEMIGKSEHWFTPPRIERLGVRLA